MTPRSAPSLRPLNRADLRDQTETARGWVVEQDGKTIAVCGVIYTVPPQAFSTMEPEMKRHPKTIVRLGKKIAQICRDFGCDVYAVADESHPRAANFLQHLGFKQTDDGMFVWKGEQ